MTGFWQKVNPLTFCFVKPFRSPGYLRSTMEPDPHHDPFVTPLRNDVVSGARVLSRKAAEVLRKAAIRLKAGSPEDFRWALARVCTQVLETQPAVAPLITLVRDVLRATDEAPNVETARHGAARAAETFRKELDKRVELVAQRAANLIPAGSRIATFSSSSTVAAALLYDSDAATRKVVCFESRPMNEGKDLAMRLAESGVEVTFAVDAAVGAIVSEVDIVLLGADSIGDLGVVNKIGSAALVTAATRLDVPVVILADETKILPTGFRQFLADDRPTGDVWVEPPAGIRIWNRYFEPVPLFEISNFVTESAILPPAEMDTMRASLNWPKSLMKLIDGARGRELPETLD